MFPPNFFPTTLVVVVLLAGVCAATETATATATATATEIIPAPSNPTQTLLQFGSAEATHHYLIRTIVPNARVTIALHTHDTTILTSHSHTLTRVSATLHNLTVTLSFDKLPGPVVYTLLAVAADKPIPVVQRTTHHVIGLAFYDLDDAAQPLVRSGEDAELFIPPSHPSVALRIAMHAPAHVTATLLSGLRLRVRAPGRDVSAAQALLPPDAVTLTQGRLVVRPASGHAGRAVVAIELPALRVGGETFETVLAVRVAGTTHVPSVRGVRLADGNVGSGKVDVMLWKNASFQVAVETVNVRADALEIEAFVGPIALRIVREQSEFDAKGQTLRFVGMAIDTDGQDGYDVRMRVRLADGMSVRAVVPESLQVRLVGNGSEESSGRKDDDMKEMMDKHAVEGEGNVVWVVVLGCVGGLLVIAGIVAGVFSTRKKESETDERGLIGSAIHIARDVYGRGSRMRMSRDGETSRRSGEDGFSHRELPV